METIYEKTIPPIAHKTRLRVEAEDGNYRVVAEFYSYPSGHFEGVVSVPINPEAAPYFRCCGIKAIRQYVNANVMRSTYTTASGAVYNPNPSARTGRIDPDRE
jgi:hypothetical protein